MKYLQTQYVVIILCKKNILEIINAMKLTQNFRILFNVNLKTKYTSSTQANKSDRIPGNESINGSDGKNYLSNSAPINNQQQYQKSVKPGRRIPLISDSRILSDSNTTGPLVDSFPGFQQDFVGLTEIHKKSDRIPVGTESILLSD